eukprot:1066694-Rhodomonas_salina.2
MAVRVGPSVGPTAAPTHVLSVLHTWLGHRVQVAPLPRMLLRACYALSGTDILHGAIGLRVVRY